jgi:murein DD-endopeptidase MepM/ murein hydrolase activator NlpD
MVIACALALLLPTAAPVAEVRPSRPKPGDLVVVEVRGARTAPHGAVAGRPLQFFPAAAGRWRALAGLPVETPLGPAGAALRVPGPGGPRLLEARFEVVDPRWRRKELRVPPQYTAERSTALDARIAEDREAFARAFDQRPSPPLFEKPFAWPRVAKPTGRFGDERTFNGTTQGQHYGTDLPGPVGAPIRAANDGVVALVHDAWASGLTVVVFHGANLYTVYFHLSAAAVREGQRVRRGERIGALGASGRASGPHLHWGARVGDLYVDPESLLRLTRAAARRAPAG